MITKGPLRRAYLFFENRIAGGGAGAPGCERSREDGRSENLACAAAGGGHRCRLTRGVDGDHGKEYRERGVAFALGGSAMEMDGASMFFDEITGYPQA